MASNKTLRAVWLTAVDNSFFLSTLLKFARDWFLERLKLVADDVLTEDERAARNSRRCNRVKTFSSAEVDTANHLQGVLKRGVQVTH